MPEVVTLPTKVLAPLTIKLDVPALVMTALPLIFKLPTVMALCKFKLALLIVSALPLLPKVPLLLTTKVPALTIVAPP